MLKTYGLLISSFLVLMGCTLNPKLTHEKIEEYFEISRPGTLKEKECIKHYNKYIRPAIKKTLPEALEKAYLFFDKTEYNAWELRGIIRYALMEHCSRVETADAAAGAVALLSPAIMGLGGHNSPYFDKLKDFNSPESFRNDLYLLAGELILLCIREIDLMRSKSPVKSKRRLADLRSLILVLPEEKSEVINITRIVWDEMAKEINEINLQTTHNLLIGAYPVYVF